jgi:uncharacterized membrane protein YeaQ/YmgE (transglycosylase-associated protein family)
VAAPFARALNTIQQTVAERYEKSDVLLAKARPTGGVATGDFVMAIESVLVWLIIGAIAGWLAGVITKGGGFGLVGNIIVGIIGAFVAGLLLPAIGLNLGTGVVAAIINAAIGGIIVLIVLSLIRRAA